MSTLPHIQSRAENFGTMQCSYQSFSSYESWAKIDLFKYILIIKNVCLSVRRLSGTDFSETCRLILMTLCMHNIHCLRIMQSQKFHKNFYVDSHLRPPTAAYARPPAGGTLRSPTPPRRSLRSPGPPKGRRVKKNR